MILKRMGFFGCLILTNSFCLLMIFTTLYSNIQAVETFREEIVSLGNNRYRVTTEEKIVHITPEEAERRAINKARERAVEYHSGVEVSSRLVNFDSEIDNSEIRQYFSNITMIMSQGFIVNQDIVKKTTEVVANIPVVRLTLELEVGTQKGEKDPYFNINTEMNQHTFRVGEKLIMTVVSSQDCYITIINIYSNETASLIFPNVANDDNLAVANRPHQIPAKDDIFSFPIHLLPGKDRDTESLLIIATKKRYDFPTFSLLSEYNTFESTLTEILKQLSRIPRNEIEIDFLEYGVFKR